MNKYLVIDFDRYDTVFSRQEFIEAESVERALGCWCAEDGDEETYDYMLKRLENVNETFSCVPGEENDILIYLLPQ